MNKSASQRWFSDLQRMNAGMQPQFRREGGQVTNITVGDINVSGKSQPMSPADIARAINREVRVGRVELRR